MEDIVYRKWTTQAVWGKTTTRLFRTRGTSDWTNYSRYGIWKPKEGTFIAHCDWRAKTSTVRMWLASQYYSWITPCQKGSSGDTVNKFPTVFQKNVGTIKGYKTNIELKEGAKPIFKKSRPVAYALQPILEAKLNRLQKEGILEPVENSGGQCRW